MKSFFLSLLRSEIKNQFSSNNFSNNRLKINKGKSLLLTAKTSQQENNIETYQKGKNINNYIESRENGFRWKNSFLVVRGTSFRTST